jgi:hypothetical protein
MTLMLEAAVSDFAQPIKKHRSGECISGFALVQSRVNAAAQFNTLQPLQGKQAALSPAQFPERHRQPFLSWIADEFMQREGGRHSALLN